MLLSLAYLCTTGAPGSAAALLNLRSGGDCDEDRRPIHVEIPSNGCRVRKWLTNWCDDRRGSRYCRWESRRALLLPISFSATLGMIKLRIWVTTVVHRGRTSLPRTTDGLFSVFDRFMFHGNRSESRGHADAAEPRNVVRRRRGDIFKLTAQKTAAKVQLGSRPRSRVSRTFARINATTPRHALRLFRLSLSLSRQTYIIRISVHMSRGPVKEWWYDKSGSLKVRVVQCEIRWKTNLLH